MPAAYQINKLGENNLRFFKSATEFWIPPAGNDDFLRRHQALMNS